MNELKLEYLEVLLGNKDGISPYHFVNALPGGTNQQKALECIRFAIEDVLGWDVQTARQKFDNYMVRLLKLERLGLHRIPAGTRTTGLPLHPGAVVSRFHPLE